jgi:protein SCO1/2
MDFERVHGGGDTGHREEGRHLDRWVATGVLRAQGCARGNVRFRRLAAILLALAVPLSLMVGIGVAQPRPELGIVEKLGSTLPRDLVLIDEGGNPVSLGSLLGKPTVLTFVYYRCPGICSPLLTELSKVVDRMDMEPGIDYRILTVSFDHREGPELARGKKESYLGALKRTVDPSFWRFMTADSTTIHALTDSAGFYFKEEGNDFVHAGALIILSPEGKVTRYVNGIQYLPFDVKMALVEAGDGKVGPTIAKILKFCYAYDPEARTYALNVTRIGGIATVLIAGVLFYAFVLRPRRKTPEGNVTYGRSV